MQTDLNDLVAFAAVARERSFTRAAAQLGVSQSALSRTVRALEERMHLRLLERTTRSVAVTEAGERLLALVSPRFSEIQAGLASLSSLADRPAGSVRITSTDFATNLYVWPRLVPMLRDHPDVHVEIVNDYGLSNIVEDGFDIGIRLGDQVEKDMVARRIGPDQTMVIVASPAYLSRHPAPVSPQGLTDHRCINLRLPTRASLLPWELKRGRRLLQVRVEGQLVFGDAYQVLAAALEDFGLAYLPMSMVEAHVKARRLRYVLEEWHPTFTGLHLYYSSRRLTSPAVALVIETLKAKTRLR